MGFESHGARLPSGKLDQSTFLWLLGDAGHQPFSALIPSFTKSLTLADVVSGRGGIEHDGLFAADSTK